MSGALAERVFAKKIENVGFADARIHDRIPFSIDDAALYPLFTENVIELMRTRLTPEVKEAVAMSVLVTAHKPAE